jgi:hypothetical protein
LSLARAMVTIIHMNRICRQLGENIGKYAIEGSTIARGSFEGGHPMRPMAATSLLKLFLGCS